MGWVRCISQPQHRHAMRFQGILTSWNDDRGFGFITPTQGGEPVFVHIKAFTVLRGRPTLNQALWFEVETNAQGKKRAANVQVAAMVKPTRADPPKPPRKAPTRRPQAEAPAPWGLAARWAVPCFVALVTAVAVIWGQVPWALVGVYAGMSVVGFMAYAFDKSAALANRWRTPESTLLLLGLLGGWPGALVAHQARCSGTTG